MAYSSKGRKPIERASKIAHGEIIGRGQHRLGDMQRVARVLHRATGHEDGQELPCIPEIGIGNHAVHFEPRVVGRGQRPYRGLSDPR